ncbi:MAG: TonB-dependent receptor plug domain-containing protein [Dysgonamonadaceae bacterium]|jgi:hypothetical protein|nr:TonB-dependent receptor plug domain-containing protein [Dysgonamonadaceae bacterium]
MKRTIVCCALLTGAVSYVTAQSSQAPDTTNARLLSEIVVTASQVDDRAPVTLQTIGAKEISDYLSTKTYPEVLRNIGGVYATAESGSYGDAKVNIRGFKQENFTVMLNGVPLSGFRSGSLFWNNWLGLTDATYRIQLQKGVGGSMLAANSMGGTINILTRPAEQEASRSVAFHVTDYGLNTLRLSLHTGETAKGWALSFTGSRTWGKGYVDATAVDAWGYFLNLRKRIDRRHSLLFTLLGSPEKHEQRSQKLSQAEIDRYGLRYNKNWGVYRGKINNVSANFYHKPYLSATHFFTLSDRAFLSNTVYFSIGNGGGKWTENAGGTKITNTLNDAGQIDWDVVVAANKSNGQALNIQSDYLAGHIGSGLKSSLDLTFGEAWKLSSGLHYQYFYSWQNERITDLLGGDYWYENYAAQSLAGWAGRNPQKTVGEFIRLHNGDRDRHLSLYSQADYTSGRIHAFAGVLLTATVYQHWDKYNYPDNYYSRHAGAWGGNVKGGVSVQVGHRQQLYFNGGFYSRAPYSNVYFASNTNEITKGVRNERNYIVEGGYKVSTPGTRFTVNAYYTYWKNKSLMSDPYKQEDRRPYLITGLDAQHAGIESNYEQKINDRLSLTAFASIGHWQWKNDVQATIYDSYSYAPVETIRVFTDGLMVGDAPQTQFGAMADIRLFDRVLLRIESRYNDRMYANFEPARRTDPNDRRQSYRMPSSFVSDVHIQCPFHLWGIVLDGFFTCNNVFNARYIERGDDGAGHDLDSFRGFWNLGRTVQVGLRGKF